MKENADRSWYCLRIDLPSDRAEEAAVCCFDWGSVGLQSETSGERERILAYFERDVEIERILSNLREVLVREGTPQVEIERVEVPEADWEAEWRRFFRPVWATPRIVIRPSWIPVPLRPGQIEVIIDPKMAFGTGEHESTQLCLQVMEERLAPGSRVLDLGTGSGVLAIAAVRMGAAKVLAVDVDPRAVDNARENAARNCVSGERLEIRTGSVEQAGESYDLIAANIQSHLLRPLLLPVREHLEEDGRALFSGLLTREEQVFCRWVEDAGLKVEEIRTRNEWMCVTAGRQV